MEVTKVTFGVFDRIELIKDKKETKSPENRPPYIYQVPLGFIPGVGGKTIEKLLDNFETEMNILHKLSKDDIEAVVGEKVANSIEKARTGNAKAAIWWRRKLRKNNIIKSSKNLIIEYTLCIKYVLDKEIFLMKKNSRFHLKTIIANHILNNSKEYILVTLIFVIGIFLGVMFINSTQDTQISEITSYFNTFIDKLKNTEKIDNMLLFQNNLKRKYNVSINTLVFWNNCNRNSNSIWNCTI